MRILIVTPLYPPDTAGHAPYVKELAKRLSSKHEICILIYGYIPEHVSGATIVTIQKKLFAPLRLFQYTYTLWKLSSTADVVYVQNGASVELPTLVVSLLSGTRFILRLADLNALRTATTQRFHKQLLLLVCQFVQAVLIDQQVQLPLFARIQKSKIVKIAFPQERPEILPFTSYPRVLISKK